MPKDENAPDELPPEIVGKIRFISSVAALVLMAGLGTLAAVVIHKIWIAPPQTSQAATMAAPGQPDDERLLAVNGTILSATASGDRLTITSASNGKVLISVFALPDGRKLHQFAIAQ